VFLSFENASEAFVNSLFSFLIFVFINLLQKEINPEISQIFTTNFAKSNKEEKYRNTLDDLEPSIEDYKYVTLGLIKPISQSSSYHLRVKI
jgi:hypothetical protein